jgi:hypothetical protein
MNLYQKGTRQQDRRYPTMRRVGLRMDICKKDKRTAIVPAIKSTIRWRCCKNILIQLTGRQSRTLTVVHTVITMPHWQEMNPLLVPPVVVCLSDVGSALTAVDSEFYLDIRNATRRGTVDHRHEVILFLSAISWS